MNKKIVLILGLALIVVVILVLFLNRPENQLSSPLSIQTKDIVPSETLIEYSDPSGFTFSYPDNLSLTSSEIEDTATYADITLSSKDVSGSLNLKITDSQFKSLEEWIKLNQGVSQEVKLGNLKALEVKLADRLLLGVLDQGVFFTIEIPLIEEDFWLKVYHNILESFSFAPPAANTGSSTNEDVTFEGEEVVE